MKIEPHWKEELAEIRSRPDTDPYQIAFTKIFNILEGMGDDELKSVICMAIWKQAVEPLVESEMIELLMWMVKEGFRIGYNGIVFNCTENEPEPYAVEEVYKLFKQNTPATGMRSKKHYELLGR